VSQARKGNDGIEFQVCVGPETGSVAFEDPALEQAVREELGIGSDEPVPSETMASMVVLNAQGRAITSLSGLEYAVNLTNLQISKNNISDLSPIQNLGRLTELRFNYNRVSELSRISRLNNLKILHFENNNIIDIGILEGMDLYDVEMGGNIISDISPISGCGNIVYLSIHSNRISDLSALSEHEKAQPPARRRESDRGYRRALRMESLSYLELEGNNVSELSPLASCRYLSFLNCRSNYVIDISPLSGLAYLSDLNLRGNDIKDISALSDLPELASLDLGEISAAGLLPPARLQRSQAAYRRPRIGRRRDT
jgi:internalin A